MIVIPKTKEDIRILMNTDIRKEPSDGKCSICKKKFYVGQRLSGRDWFLAHTDCIIQNPL
jgi:hypothetical protein